MDKPSTVGEAGPVTWSPARADEVAWILLQLSRWLGDGRRSRAIVVVVDDEGRITRIAEVRGRDVAGALTGVPDGTPWVHHDVDGEADVGYLEWADMTPGAMAGLLGRLAVVAGRGRPAPSAEYLADLPATFGDYV